MSILQKIRIALSSEASELSGIHKYSENAPNKIEEFELPFLWTELGIGAYSDYAADIIQTTLPAKIIVACSTKTSGLNSKDIETIEDLFETCEEAFYNLGTIDVENVQSIKILNGSGAAILEGYSRNFLGFYFDLELTILKYKTYVDRQ